MPGRAARDGVDCLCLERSGFFSLTGKFLLALFETCFFN